jgi:hypothetical protein
MLNAWVYSLPGGSKVFGARDPAIVARERAEQQKRDEDQNKLNSLEAQVRANQEAMTASSDSKAIADYKSTIQRLQAEINQIYDRRGDSQNARQIPRFHSGTLGVTGEWWLNSDQTANLQAGEAVVTQSQMSQIVDTASQKGLAEALQRVNSTQVAMIAVLNRIANASEQNVNATKDLNGNLWAA